MEICIRRMQPNEAFTVFKLGVITFHSMEGIFMGKPKDAIVALDGEKIVGAVTYKKYKYKDGLLGYVDYAFTSHAYQGKGIGNKLYAAAVEELKKVGCNQFCGLVRGDNPGSFRLFEKLNMNRCTLKEARAVLGSAGMMKLLLSTPLGWGPAMDCYLSDTVPRKDSNLQIGWYLLANLCLLMLGILQYKEDILWAVAAGMTVMLAGVIFGASVHMIIKHTYHFRLTIGGYFITAIVALVGGFFPLNAKWYPEQFENTNRQRKELCIPAVIEWIGILLIYILAKLCLNDFTYGAILQYDCIAMIAFKILPTFPFCEYGGRRIYQYRKSLYAVLWIISAIVIAVSEHYL